MWHETVSIFERFEQDDWVYRRSSASSSWREAGWFHHFSVIVRELEGQAKSARFPCGGTEAPTFWNSRALIGMPLPAISRFTLFCCFLIFFLMLTCAITMSSYEHTKGKIDVSTCSIVRPFTGELTVVRSEAPVKSIELQLVRVETCGCLEGYAKDVRWKTCSSLLLLHLHPRASAFASSGFSLPNPLALSFPKPRSPPSLPFPSHFSRLHSDIIQHCFELGWFYDVLLIVFMQI